VNYQALLQSGLAEMQAFTESRMTERIVIDRGTTSDEVDENGYPVTTWTTIYDGPGRLRSYRPYEQTPLVGLSTVTQQRIDWHIPAPERCGLLARTWNGPVQAGDRARRMTPGKPVKVVRIAGEHDVTDQTAQRFVVDEQTAGAWAGQGQEES
jgi:hypothetical protein